MSFQPQNFRWNCWFSWLFSYEVIGGGNQQTLQGVKTKGLRRCLDCWRGRLKRPNSKWRNLLDFTKLFAKKGISRLKFILWASPIARHLCISSTCPDWLKLWGWHWLKVSLTAGGGLAASEDAAKAQSHRWPSRPQNQKPKATRAARAKARTHQKRNNKKEDTNTKLKKTLTYIWAAT